MTSLPFDLGSSSTKSMDMCVQAMSGTRSCWSSPGMSSQCRLMKALKKLSFNGPESPITTFP
ncbi:hypothetical protein PVAP13_3NG091500 [Panicum virgatum]|uniref:Uncharacterized protein n=1 Tax=Panicum virgatum TaxID=38727 RepID=A0A8T0UHZ8_PANVG|nr:hypothetical protein PVAP13_3NG091500 [Panicum virgatum]